MAKVGAKATAHEASAVTPVESSRTLRCPRRSPSRASTGTTSADSTSWAASNQFTSASRMESRSAMSLKIGV